MKDIHVYVYGSNVFATLLIEIGTGYSIFFKEENNSEDSSDIKDVVRIIFPEKLVNNMNKSFVVYFDYVGTRA